jgi:hypothetical protein
MQTAKPSSIRRSHTNDLAGLLALLVLASGTAEAVIITVTGTGDSVAVDDVVTLREAIGAAHSNTPVGDAPAGDALPVVDEIHFNIAPGGVQTIQPLSALPTITEAVVIDGWTQPGFTPRVELMNDSARSRLHLHSTPAHAGLGPPIGRPILARFLLD